MLHQSSKNYFSYLAFKLSRLKLVARLQNRNLPEYLSKAIDAHIPGKLYPSFFPSEDTPVEEIAD